MTVGRLLGSALLLVPLAALAQDGQTIGWQEAVARLAAERTRAEACAALLKKYGDEAAKDRGKLAYDSAKAEVDGVISGLVVALAKKQEPASLAGLQERLKSGFDEREAFCASVQPLVPTTSGQKGVIDEIVKGALEPLIQAVQAVYFRHKDDDALTRKTIQTQLEATKWLDFAAVSPPPA